MQLEGLSLTMVAGDTEMMLDALAANLNLRIERAGPNEVHILAARD